MHIWNISNHIYMCLAMPPPRILGFASPVIIPVLQKVGRPVRSVFSTRNSEILMVKLQMLYR